MSTVSPVKLEAAVAVAAVVKAIEKYNAIEVSLVKKTEEEVRALRTMDGTSERIRTLGIEGDCAAADALIEEVNNLYVEAILETVAMGEVSLEAQKEMMGAFAAAGMSGSYAFKHYYCRSVVDPETKEMVARMVLLEEASNNNDDERPAKRRCCCSLNRLVCCGCWR